MIGDSIQNAKLQQLSVSSQTFFTFHIICVSLPHQPESTTVMRKHFFFAFLLFLAMPAMAQLRSHHAEGQGPATALTIVSTNDQDFWLFVDDVLQNENPVRSICVTGFWADQFHIRVELDNPLHNCVGQYVDMARPQSLSIIQRQGMLGFDFKPVQVRPQLTMELKASQITATPVAMPEPALPQVPAPMPSAMNPKDYDDAYRMISGQNYDNTKLTMAKQVIASNPMTASQILGICKLFSFENNKLEFAKHAYSHCTERNKYYLINEAFSYEASKQELIDYINGL